MTPGVRSLGSSENRFSYLIGQAHGKKEKKNIYRISYGTDNFSRETRLTYDAVALRYRTQSRPRRRAHVKLNCGSTSHRCLVSLSRYPYVIICILHGKKNVDLHAPKLLEPDSTYLCGSMLSGDQ